MVFRSGIKNKSSFGEENGKLRFWRFEAVLVVKSKSTLKMSYPPIELCPAEEKYKTPFSSSKKGKSSSAFELTSGPKRIGSAQPVSPLFFWM